VKLSPKIVSNVKKRYTFDPIFKISLNNSRIKRGLLDVLKYFELFSVVVTCEYWISLLKPIIK